MLLYILQLPILSKKISESKLIEWPSQTFQVLIQEKDFRKSDLYENGKQYLSKENFWKAKKKPAVNTF